MIRNLSELSVRLVFYEALCGEFKAHTDEMDRIHSLGRMAQAAFSRGEATKTSDAVGFKLRPSWAHHVEIKVGCSYAPDEQTPYLLDHIRLKNAHDEELGVMDITTNKVDTVLLWQPGFPTEEVRLGYGPGTNDARNHIAMAANIFINRDLIT